MSISKGNSGEHLVMAELLAQEFDAYWADRGNPAFDIACFWNATGRSTRLRVKTTSDGTAVWNKRKKGLFLDVQSGDDYVVICDIRRGIRGADIFIVPTRTVEEHLTTNHAHYISQPGKGGKARSASTNIRVLRFFGEHRRDNWSYGYQDKFSCYKDKWESLR